MDGLSKGYSIRTVGALNFLLQLSCVDVYFPSQFPSFSLSKSLVKPFGLQKGPLLPLFRRPEKITATFDIVTFYAAGDARCKQGNYLKGRTVRKVMGGGGGGGF